MNKIEVNGTVTESEIGGISVGNLLTITVKVGVFSVINQDTEKEAVASVEKLEVEIES